MLLYIVKEISQHKTAKINIIVQTKYSCCQLHINLQEKDTINQQECCLLYSNIMLMCRSFVIVLNLLSHTAMLTLPSKSSIIMHYHILPFSRVTEVMVLHTSDPRKEEGSTLEGHIEWRQRERRG